MKKSIKILLLEDEPNDAHLIISALKRSKLQFESLVVDAKDKYIEALRCFSPEVILADHSLYSFNSIDALNIFHETGLKIPFILVTATVSEEFAVDILKKGADDYILKDRLHRLPIAIQNALEKYRLQQERQDLLEQTIKNEKRFRAIIENTGDGIALLSAKGKLHYLSSSIQNILGYSPEEAMELNLFSLAHPDDSFLLTDLKKRSLRQPGVPVKGAPARMLHKDGTWKWIDGTLTNMLHDPAINAIIDNFRDVTYKVNAEKKIKENEAKYRSFFENSMDGIFLTEKNGKVLAANKAACEIFRMTEKEMCTAGKGWFVDFSDERLRVLLKERERNGRAKGEVTYKRKDGSKFLGEIAISVFNDAFGNERTSVIIRDITERKLAEQHLLESELFNKGILASLSSHIAVVNKDGTIFSVNKAWNNFAKANDGNLLCTSEGSNYFRVCENSMAGGDTLAAQTLEGIQSVFRKEAKSFELEYPCHSKEEQRWFTLSVLNFGDDDSKVVISHQNITQRKLAENKLSATSIDLQKALTDLNKIMYSSLDVICSINEEGEFVKVSAASKTIWGHSPTALIGKKFIDFVYSEDIEATIQVVTNIKNGMPVTMFENRMAHIDGKIVNLLWSAKWDSDEKLMFSVGKDVTEKIKAEEQNQFKANLLNIIGQAAIATDTNGLVNYWNKAAEQIYGWSRQEAIGKNIINLTPSQETKKQAQQIMQSLKQGRPWSGELTVQRKDGTSFPAFITNSPIYDHQQNLTGIIGISSDITEKKALEELLSKTNRLAAIGSWEIDVVTQTLYWSDMIRNIFEVDAHFGPNLAKAKTFIKEKTAKEKIAKQLQDCIGKGKSWDEELLIVTAKGNEKWVRVIGEAECVGGKCLRVYGSLQDIDARKKAEIGALKIYEEKNSILESIGDGFFTLNNEWQVTYWNKEAEKMLSKAKDKILHHNLWEVFSTSINSTSYIKFHQALDTNEVVLFQDYYEDTKKWFDISAYPSASGLSVFFKDITERKLSEARLNELNTELQTKANALAISNKELEQFAYVASHDLQEPLRMVTSFLTLIEKKYGHIIDDKGKKYIHFAVDGAKRMRQIILDLLEFSRVGRVEETPEPVDVKDLLKEIISLHRKQIEETGAIIKIYDLCSLETYKIPLRQVLQNLLGNALKYHKADVTPFIEISCVDAGAEWQFSVKDNGIGISAEYFEKIFIIFQQLHAKDEYHGSGMGLAICKKIVENLNGKIWLESEEQKGSTFYFTIPKPYYI